MTMQDFHEDIPLLVRGKLDAARARQVLSAAENDAALRSAIEAERALEELLDLYDVPEPSHDLGARFWKRFHLGDVASGAWWIRLAGPLAAGVLIAVGVVVFFRGDTAPPVTPEVTAEQPAEVVDEDLDWDAVMRYSAQPEPAPGPHKLGDEDLALLRKLDSEAFLELDRLAQPDDLNLVDDLALLRKLDAAEGK